MALRTFTCPHCGANMMIEIGRRKAVCEYCDSEIYIDEIISEIKKDRNGKSAEDEKTYHSGAQAQAAYTGGLQFGDYQGGAYTDGTYENLTQSQNYPHGYSMARAKSGYASPKSRMAALLLCVFFGVFGIHRFYVGKIGTGILYFFTGSIFGVGWIFDIIMIVTGAFRDSRGLPLVNW